MKKLIERMDELLDQLVCLDFRTSMDVDKAKTLIRKALKNETKNRLKELESMGEFKTAEEAGEYCRLHGLGGIGWKSEIFQIAGALMDARKDERRKIGVELQKNAKSPK